MYVPLHAGNVATPSPAIPDLITLVVYLLAVNVFVGVTSACDAVHFHA